MAGELSEDELAFLQGVLDHAREGHTSELAEVIAKGVPVNLTGATGDSLLILAAYHDHPHTVRMLLELARAHPRTAAQVDGTSAPPSSATRLPKCSSAACEAILPATSASPSPNAEARASSPGGTAENTLCA